LFTLQFLTLFCINSYVVDIASGKFNVTYSKFNKVTGIKTSDNSFVSLSYKNNKTLKIFPNSKIKFKLNEQYNLEFGAILLKDRDDKDIDIEYKLFFDSISCEMQFFRIKLPPFNFDISSDVKIDFVSEKETRTIISKLNKILVESDHVYYGFFIPYFISWDILERKIELKIFKNNESFIEIVDVSPVQKKEINYQKLVFSKTKSTQLKNADRTKYQKEQNERHKIFNDISSNVFFNNGYRHPLENEITDIFLTSNFGLTREWFFTDGTKYSKDVHLGVDYARKKGTEIYAVSDGVIKFARENTEYYGNMIIIEHGMSFVTEYCHLDKIDVKEGSFVKKNQLIGRVGMTGAATGPHLHWGARLYGIPIDPRSFYRIEDIFGK